MVNLPRWRDTQDATCVETLSPARPRQSSTDRLIVDFQTPGAILTVREVTAMGHPRLPRQVLVVSVIAGAALLGSQLRGQQPSTALPGTRLSIDELQRQMFHIGAGRRLKPPSWPGGARIAVGLSFDVD